MVVKLILLVLGLTGCLAVQLVMQPGAQGPDVVETVINMIRSTCILPKDNLMLRRLAYVETQDGSLPRAYGNPNNNGGIWQVTRDMFLETQSNRELQAQRDIIWDSLHILWNVTTWQDLRKPLYSGLGAALYLSSLTNATSPIPLKIEEQATFWRNNYDLRGNAHNYTELAETLELGCHVSQRQVDILFVVDTSSSLSQDDITRVKNFLNDIVDGFHVGRDTTHVALITYSSIVTVQFSLNKYLTNVDVKTAINMMHITQGATNTASALNGAVHNIFDPSKGGRTYAVKVAILITDGKSDDSINTKHASTFARDNGIAIFTVGVGDKIDNTELNTVATPPTCVHSFLVNGFDTIKNLKQEIQASVCRAPLYANETVTCEIDKCPPYAFPFTGSHGITVLASVTCDGDATVYGDVNNYYPSKASNLFSGIIGHSGLAQYQAKPDPKSDFLYVTVLDPNHRGKGCNATLTPLVGDKTVKKVDVICREEVSGKERPCEKPDLIQFRPLICDGYTSSIANPCKSGDEGLRYPYPNDNTRYIICLHTGQFSVAQCPTNTIFDANCRSCYGQDVPKVNCQTSYNGSNPCTAENLKNGLFFFPFPGDHNKYIQCDLWGGAYERSCGSGSFWVNEHYTCETPGTKYNPCGQMKLHGQRFYAYPVDQHLFIECIDPLNPRIMNCTAGAPIWDDCVKTCVRPQEFSCGPAAVQPTQPSFQPVNIGGLITLPTMGYRTTTEYIPPGALGPAYTPPCTEDNLRKNQLYFEDKTDQHNWIQCDLAGFSFRHTCKDGWFYNPLARVCVDGPVKLQLVGKK